MIRETYKGRKIRITRGRDGNYGRALVTLNGVPNGSHLGSEEDALDHVRRTIDHIDTEPVNGDRWPAVWYAPGTFELCDNGHPREIGGTCRHSYCNR